MNVKFGHDGEDFCVKIGNDVFAFYKGDPVHLETSGDSFVEISREGDYSLEAKVLWHKISTAVTQYIANCEVK